MKSVKVIEPDLPAIWVDPFMLKRILSNFLSNAVKCTDEGSITTSARRVGKTLVLAVQDTGCGIEEGHLNTIFDKGVRLSPDRGGSGLGLAICREFAARIGGTITVESVLDAGSTFTVTLSLSDRLPPE